jgi:hypothetical protein
MATVSSVPGFLPSTNGLHFANRFPPGPTVRLGPFDTRWIGGLGDASAGLCGGMAWYVRERFAAGLPIPPDTVAPANGSPLFQALVRRQVLSLEWMRTPLGFWWMGGRGGDRAARRTRDSELSKIRSTIDGGRLAMVGLVRHLGWNPMEQTESHQVLAYAIDAEGGTTILRLYDPNWPNRDDVTITIEPAAIRQSTGEVLFGVLSLG